MAHYISADTLTTQIVVYQTNYSKPNPDIFINFQAAMSYKTTPMLYTSISQRQESHLLA
jgi:hypothetical protein